MGVCVCVYVAMTYGPIDFNLIFITQSSSEEKPYSKSPNPQLVPLQSPTPVITGSLDISLVQQFRHYRKEPLNMILSYDPSSQLSDSQ
jgi:hypothetical protein